MSSGAVKSFFLQTARTNQEAARDAKLRFARTGELYENQKSTEKTSLFLLGTKKEESGRPAENQPQLL